MPTSLILHADWSLHPKKRWMCAATRSGSGFFVASPEPVGELATFWDRVRDRAEGGTAVVGFDFPIGVPAAYARAAGITSFTDALRDFGSGEWKDFYRVAENEGEIGVRRPFYPQRPGGTCQQHLLDGLGVESMDALLRRCDRATATRGAASSIFWTMGAKQVGKAAIAGWKGLLAPAFRSGMQGLRVWPFDGALGDLVADASIVVVETYPAEACLHVGCEPPGRSWSKGSRDGRRKQAEPLIAWARTRGVVLEPELIALLHDGFGDSADGEDRLDAVLGALSMIEVVEGHRAAGAPSEPAVQSVEGWILGQGGEGLPTEPDRPRVEVSAGGGDVGSGLWRGRLREEVFRFVDADRQEVTEAQEVTEIVLFKDENWVATLHFFPASVTVRRARLEWDGPYTPVRCSVPVFTEWFESNPDFHVSVTAALDFSERINSVIRRRVSTFRECKYCGEVIPPEYRYDDETCQECASEHLGVVY